MHVASGVPQVEHLRECGQHCADVQSALAVVDLGENDGGLARQVRVFLEEASDFGMASVQTAPDLGVHSHLAVDVERSCLLLQLPHHQLLRKSYFLGARPTPHLGLERVPDRALVVRALLEKGAGQLGHEPETEGE